jgi:hypothetical protein
MGVFYIPLLVQRETFVKCSQCGIVRLTPIPLAELGQYSAEELTPHLRQRVSIVVKVLAMASLLMFFIPVFGLILSGIGLLVSYRVGGWPKRVSLIGLGLSVISSIFWGIVLLTEKH